MLSDQDPGAERARGERGNGRAGRSPLQQLIEAVSRSGFRAAEMGSHFGTWLEVQADRTRSAARRKIAQLALGAIVFVALSLVVAAACLRVVSGVSGAAASLAGGRAWAGDLLGGSLVLVIVAGGIAIAWKAAARSRLKELEAKYAERRRRHQERFGPQQPVGDGTGAN